MGDKKLWSTACVIPDIFVSDSDLSSSHLTPHSTSVRGKNKTKITFCFNEIVRKKKSKGLLIDLTFYTWLCTIFSTYSPCSFGFTNLASLIFLLSHAVRDILSLPCLMSQSIGAYWFLNVMAEYIILYLRKITTSPLTKLVFIIHFQWLSQMFISLEDIRLYLHFKIYKKKKDRFLLNFKI